MHLTVIHTYTLALPFSTCINTSKNKNNTPHTVKIFHSQRTDRERPPKKLTRARSLKNKSRSRSGARLYIYFICTPVVALFDGVFPRLHTYIHTYLLQSFHNRPGAYLHALSEEKKSASLGMQAAFSYSQKRKQSFDRVVHVRAFTIRTCTYVYEYIYICLRACVYHSRGPMGEGGSAHSGARDSRTPLRALSHTGVLIYVITAHEVYTLYLCAYIYI